MAKRASSRAFDITLTIIGRNGKEQEATVNPFRFQYARNLEGNQERHVLHFDGKLQLKVSTPELNEFLALRAEVMRELAAAFLAQLYAEAGRTLTN